MNHYLSRRSSQVQNTSATSTASSSGSAATSGTSTSAGSPAAATTATTTTSTNLANPLSVPTANVVLAMDCVGLNGTDQTITVSGKDYVFGLYCGADYVRTTASGSIDIFAATVYTLNDCLRVCATYNLASNKNLCIGVSFSASESSARFKHTWVIIAKTILTVPRVDLSSDVAGNNGNCWAKNATGVTTQKDNAHMGALLQT
jgi:hypothetical protein